MSKRSKKHAERNRLYRDRHDSYAISEKEVKSLQKRMGVEEPKFKIDVSVGSPVRITDGPFKNLEGKITNIDETKGKVKVLVSMFGRETPVELDFLQIKKI